MTSVLLMAAISGPGCGGAGSGTPRSEPPVRSTGVSANPGRIPVEHCAAPSADTKLVADRDLPGALAAGPLVVYAPGLEQLARGARDVVQAPEVVVIKTVPMSVVLSVREAARSRFSLLFAGAGTGSTTSGLRVADGISSVRFPACGRTRLGFRGGFVFRGAQCVPIAIQAAGGPVRLATIAVGRRSARCRNALRPHR